MTAILLVVAPSLGPRAGAQERGILVVPEDIRMEEGFDASSSRALFVGVSEFADERFASVPFAVDDAVDLAHLFAIELQLVDPDHVVLSLSGEPQKPDSGERLRVLTDAGAARTSARQPEVLQRLRELGQSSGSTGLFIVAVASHGFSDRGSSYLVASESRRAFMEDTGIKVERVFDEVSRANARRRLVFLDACRERLSAETRAGGADPESAASQALVEAIGDAEGQVVLSASRLGGYSYDDHRRQNGVFSAAVVDGLRGAASVNEQNFVTVRTLAGFVNERVTAWVEANRPDHARAGAGIEIRFDGAGDEMPLAVSPTATRTAYVERRDAALERLRENLGRHITGAIYDAIAQALAPDMPNTARLELLTEVEALDGSDRSQRILADYFQQRRGDLLEEEPPPPTPAPTPLDSETEELCGRRASGGNRGVQRVLGTNFEDLHVFRPNRIDPFEHWDRGRAMETSEPPEGLTRWQPTRVAYSGEFGLSPTPNGNPGITGSAEINSVVLPRRFDVTGIDEIILYFYKTTTSNPRVRTVHNCDSSLNVYYKYDDRPWAHRTAICGEHKTESRGWRPASFSFNTSLVSTVQFAFVYGLQNNPEPDPEAYFVIDDLEVCTVP